MNTNLVIDVGNTRTAVALYQKHRQTILTHFISKADDFLSQLDHFCQNHSFTTICLSSVVPKVTELIIQHCQNNYLQPLINVTAHTELGLRFWVKDPGFMGADLIVNAFAALQKYQQHCLIFDLGTATTVQLVSSDGLFMGYSILPGLMTGAKSLFTDAAGLSVVPELASMHEEGVIKYELLVMNSELRGTCQFSSLSYYVSIISKIMPT